MKTKIICIWLLTCCIGCNTMVATSGKDDNATSDANGNTTTNEKQLSDGEKAKIRAAFRESLVQLENAKSSCDEYRVLIVNWASFDNESPDFFKIVNGLTNGGEIWLNSHAADVIDENWKSYGNANYEGTFKTLPALINWVGSYGWRLIEVHDSKLSSINYPEKLYFVKKVDAGKLRDVK